jgi:hypothetical protein
MDSKGNQVKVEMHREVLGLSPGDGIICDHKNQNGLDNQKSNLIRSTKILNGLNCKTYSNNTSGIRGVSFRKSINKWVAHIRINRRKTYLGAFGNKEDAARAYCSALNAILEAQHG